MDASFIVIGASNPDIIRLLENSHPFGRLKPNLLGFVDKRFSQDFQSFCGFPVLGSLAALELEDFRSSHVVNTVAGSTNSREAVTDYLSSIGRRPSSVVASNVLLEDIHVGNGVLVYLNTYIGAGVGIGDHSVISDSARVGHETSIGSHAFVGPGVVICGRVTVGDLAFLGAGAIVLPRLSIGRGSVVGAGAVVTTDIPDGVTVVGNPARPTR